MGFPSGDAPSKRFPPMHAPRRFPHTLPALIAGLALVLAGVTTPAGALEPSPPAPNSTESEKALGEGAPVHGLSRTELAHLLRTDSTMHVDPDGRLYAVDPARPASTEPPSTAPAVAPLAQTFTLHSRPGATGTVYLDFDGVSVGSGNAWVGLGLDAGAYEGWDPEGNGAGFTDSEQEMIQEVWARVAEDFAPFDIDVTTQQPSGSWPGTSAVVSDSASARLQLCASACAGIAFVGTWGTATAYRPAWVLTGGGLGSARDVAETVSHEVGHNLGLNHHGTTTKAYYSGHANWAPIMGAGYVRDVTQWSHGSYPLANNPTQDDVARIAHVAGLAEDDAPDTAAQAAEGAWAGIGGTGTISTRDDADVFNLGVCTGAVTISAQPAVYGPNLDIEASLLASDGSALLAANPANQLSASGSVGVATGTYYLRVDGVGTGSPSTAYDDYASMGGYQWSVTGCQQAPVGTASAPIDFAALFRPTTGAVLMTWATPLDEGAAPVTGYRLTIGDRVRNLPADQFEARAYDLAPGTYTASVAAVNAHGRGQSSTATVTVEAPDPTTTTLNGVADGLSVTLTAAVAPTNGVTAQGSIAFTRDGAPVGDATLVGGSAAVTLQNLPLGPATYAATYLPADQRWAASEATPITVEVTGTRLRTRPTLRLSAPTSTRVGAQPVVRVQVRADGQPATGQVRVRYGARSHTVRLRNGVARVQLLPIRADRKSVV